MRSENSKINCSTFHRQEPIIKGITDKINRAKELGEKVRYANELQKEVDVLLSCQEYNLDNFDCKNCHSIASLRKAAANLIIKAKKLGGKNA